MGAASATILRKALLTLITGGIAYVVTNLADQPQVWSLTMSIFIGGVTLVVQFLVDFEARLRTATELSGLIEASALRTDVVTQLVRHATQIEASSPPLILDFVQAEIFRMSEFLKELAEGGDVTYDGDDPNWLLGLTSSTARTIDATSMTTTKPGSSGFVDEAFWNSDLGLRYLDYQREAVRRGVTIRRVFILDQPDMASSPELVKIYKAQKEYGIDVRVLDPFTIPGTRKSSMFDFILFDNIISYEFTAASRFDDGIAPALVNTRLVRQERRIADRVQRFQDLWEYAREID